jgi:hypothetical protein
MPVYVFFGWAFYGTRERVPFHAGVCFLWVGWRKRRGLRFWLKRAEVLGQIETLGVLRCAQDDGKNLQQQRQRLLQRQRLPHQQLLLQRQRLLQRQI